MGRTRRKEGVRITDMETKETTFCPQCREVLAKTETCIREHPDEAALVSLGAGFLLAQFPLRLLMAAVARLVVMVLKPAVVFYALFRMAEDVYARQSPAPPSNEEVSP